MLIVSLIYIFVKTDIIILIILTKKHPEDLYNFSGCILAI